MNKTGFYHRRPWGVATSQSEGTTRHFLLYFEFRTQYDDCRAINHDKHDKQQQQLNELMKLMTASNVRLVKRRRENLGIKKTQRS